MHLDLSGGSHLPALMRMCERKASMDTLADCSLCHQPFLSLTQLRRHMGMHLEQLALFAIPPNLGETEDDSEAGSNKEAEKESIGSGRTESEADDDETASNKEAPHDDRTKESEELAEDAIDTGEDETAQVIEERSDKERPRRIVVEERRRSNIIGTDEESSPEEEGDLLADFAELDLFLRTGIPPKNNYVPPQGRSPPNDGRTKESEELAEDAIDTGEDETAQVIKERSDKERPRRIVVEERRRSNIIGTDKESSSEEEGDPLVDFAELDLFLRTGIPPKNNYGPPQGGSPPDDSRTKESEELAKDTIDTREDETIQVIKERSDKERPRQENGKWRRKFGFAKSIFGRG